MSGEDAPRGAKRAAARARLLASAVTGDAAASVDPMEHDPTRPPPSDPRPRKIVQHGVEREDDYAWLRADDWRGVMRDPSRLPADIRARLEAENAYVDATLADIDGLTSRLFDEMRGRTKEDDSSVPAPDGAYAYYTRYREGGQHPIFARHPIDPATKEKIGDEQILLDGDKEAEGFEFFDFGGVDHSPDHKTLAYAVDTNGSEDYEIRFRDLDTGKDLPDRLPIANGGFVWANDSKTLFYIERDDNHRSAKCRRHKLGANPRAAAVVYHEQDGGFFVSVGKTETDRHILIESHDHTTTEIRVIDAATPESPPRLIAPRRSGVEYDLSERGDQFYICTNLNGALDFKIMTAPIAAPGPENWVDWIPARPGVLVLDQCAFARHHVRLEREGGLPRLVIRRFEDGAEHEIAFDEAAYSLGVGSGYEFDTDVMRFVYASPTTPDAVFDYDMNSRARRLLKVREVPSGHDPKRYVAERVFALAPDGAEVPITLLRHVDTPVDGTAPLLLYGYGAYGVTIPADFRTARLSLVDRGFVYAIAHVRGGMAKGYQWYLDGRREKKANSFNDFLTAARTLTRLGYAAPGRIVAMGGSAGGLLVGVAVNEAPELFCGVVAAVPFVDVLNTMSDAQLPLTPPEWPEWGDPILNADDFARIASYSPYENVAAKPYPPILATAGLSDSRVTYWEAAKWIARLRERSTSDAPMLLKTNMEAGHGGAAGRFDALKETALEFAFALKVAGLADAEPKPSR